MGVTCRMIHTIFNIYLIILLIGMLLVLLKLHDLKHLLMTFTETTKFLCLVINNLDTELKQDECTIEERVNKINADIAEIIRYIDKKEK